MLNREDIKKERSINLKLDKKGKLIISIFKYGKRHIDKSNFWDRINFKIYEALNALICIGIFNTEMKASKNINSAILLYHPYGIVINGDAIVKKGVVIRQQVTIGNKGINDTRCPVIEENVEIGAGAKIIGPIHIGKNSIIGANAVVTKSFPPNSVIVGVPGKSIARKEKD